MNSGASAADQRRKKRRLGPRFGTLLALCIVFINGFAIALGGMSLSGDYRQNQQRAEANSENIAQLMAAELRADFERIDLALLSVADEANKQLATRGKIDREAIKAFLARLHPRLPELASLVITDADGEVGYGAGLPQGRTSNVADRDYFSAQAGSSSDALIIGAPLVTRLSHVPAVPVSRRLSRPDGSFAGVVLANLSIDHINQTFAGVDVGRNGSIALRNEEFALVARHPMLESKLSEIGSKVFFPEARVMMQAGYDTGTVVSRFQADQIERTVSFRKLSSYPFYVLVGLAREEYLAEWRTEAARMAAALALFALLTVLAGRWMHRSWRRQREQQSVLAAQAERISQDVVALELAALKARKLTEAVEQSPAVVVITDVRGKIEYVNPKFTEVTGYSYAEAVGQNPRILKSGLTPVDVYRGLWQTILAGRQWHGELLNARKSGELIWENTWISPLIGEDGAISHFIAVKEDITERKLAANELEQHRSQLERIVLQRTAELREALAAAKQADKAKDEFLANITHELRTPLSAVIGFSGLARRYAMDERLREYLEKVNSAGRTLSGIVDDLLDLSKIVAGRMMFESLPFSLRGLIMRCRSVISYKAEEKGLALVESVAEEVPDLLVGDALRLEQILLNLLSNAVKFTASGRVELRVGVLAREEQRINLNIEVEDTGIGLREEEMALLFKPFSQADASVTRKFGGTGLGLAICKRLAEMMDGDISVTSREGRGTCFCVRVWLGLGAAGQTLSPEQAWSESSQVRYQGARVLVVDDQAFNRDVVEGLLGVVGITPLNASNGQEALDILSSDAEGFDLLLMDVQMPVMDGITATRLIRKLDGLEHLPIIAMTAHTMAHERERHFAGGMNDHIGKPFDEESFYRLLAKWIPVGKQRLQPAAHACPAPATTMPPLAGVDTQAGLALLQNDEARYRRWLGEFAQEAPAALAEIRRALVTGEPEPASMAAHTLKGRTGLLGMKDAHRIAAALEAAIDSGAPSDDLLLDLEQDLAAICAQINTVMANAAKPSA